MGSPAHTACLPDARELQKMQIQFLRLGEKEGGGRWGRGGGRKRVEAQMARRRLAAPGREFWRLSPHGRGVIRRVTCKGEGG